MVQSIVPTSYFCCPCELISGACSAIGSLPQRIADCVYAIFAAIAEFVQTCTQACFGTPAAPPPAAPVAAANSAPSAPVALNLVEEGKAFLRAQPFLSKSQLNMDCDMNDEIQIKAFCALHLARNLVTDFDSLRSTLSTKDSGALSYPLMLTVAIEPSKATFLDWIQSLSNRFKDLSEAEKAVIVNYSTTTDIREYPNAASLNEGILLLASRFMGDNPIFTASVDALIEEYRKRSA